MELKAYDDICRSDGHEGVCLTCSGKKREDLLDRAEVVEVLAIVSKAAANVEELDLVWELVWEGAERLSISTAVEQRAKEMEEER